MITEDICGYVGKHAGKAFLFYCADSERILFWKSALLSNEFLNHCKENKEAGRLAIRDFFAQIGDDIAKGLL